MQGFARLAAIGIGLAALALGGAASCQSTPSGDTGMNIADLNGEWVLKQIEGANVADMLPAGAKLPTLSVNADGSVSGFGGVNRLSSKLDTEGLAKGEFKLGPVMSTKMAGAPQAMELESRFTRLLSEVESYRFDSEALVLTPKGKGPPLRFTRGS